MLMNFRTDLALEGISGSHSNSRIKQSFRGKVFKITDISIADDSLMNSVGKGKGRYVTLECDGLSRFSDDYKDMAIELSSEITSFIPNDGDILIIGLGNNDITPDALGPQVASKILATRHLRHEQLSADEQQDFLTSLRPVSVIAGGVLGQTGIESAELALAVCHQVHPAAVIAVDALACSDISRLGSTIQISDAGICPGSGVANSRKELSSRIFGVPVIAVGVPTVVDMHTIVQNITHCPPPENTPNMMVTPRDIDRLTERAALLISYALNLALQPSLSFDDVTALF